jgi:hypothetical protein
MPRAVTRGHQRIGTIACLVCTHEIPVKKTEGGKLSLACPWCDAPIYLNAGSEAERLVLERVKLDAPPAPAPSSSADPARQDHKPLQEKKQPPAAPPAAPPARRFTGPLGNPFGGTG